MKYNICHDGSGYMRIRIDRGRISETEAEVLRFAFSRLKGLKAVMLYPATGGIGLRYSMTRDELIRRLDAFLYENVSFLAKEESRRRTIAGAGRGEVNCSRKKRRNILIEAIADSILPAPLQLAYHAWQYVQISDGI